MDFPEPDGPMIATNSPARTRRLTPLSACTAAGPSPYTLIRSWTSISHPLPAAGGCRVAEVSVTSYVPPGVRPPPGAPPGDPPGVPPDGVELPPPPEPPRPEPRT